MKRAKDALAKRRLSLFIEALEERRVMAVWVGTDGMNQHGNFSNENTLSFTRKNNYQSNLMFNTIIFKIR